MFFLVDYVFNLSSTRARSWLLILVFLPVSHLLRGGLQLQETIIPTHLQSHVQYRLFAGPFQFAVRQNSLSCTVTYASQGQASGLLQKLEINLLPPPTPASPPTNSGG